MAPRFLFSSPLALTAALLLACGGNSRGGDGDAAPDPVDAQGEDASTGVTPEADGAPISDGGPQADACNPVTQQGCDAGEKCTWIVAQVSPTFLGQTACVRDGNVDLSGACMGMCIPRGSTEIGPECGDENAPDPTAIPPVIGTDDCKAGGICVNQMCRAICQGQGSCGAEDACVGYGDLFTDADDIGACSATCDPLAQDCGEGFGCYVDPFPGHGYATCESEIHPERTQGAPCPTGDCPLNGCAAGYGPWLQDDGAATCTAISGAVETYLDDTDGGGTGTLIGDPLGTPGVDCGETRIGVTGHQSYFLQSFYGNTGDTPAAWGICAPSGIENGDCSEFSVELLFSTYDAAEADPDPATGQEALVDLCATTERCGFACVSTAQYDALSAAYCVAHAGSPACIEPASSNARRRIRSVATGAPDVESRLRARP